VVTDVYSTELGIRLSFGTLGTPLIRRGVLNVENSSHGYRIDKAHDNLL
jgi:hypothetical protein